MSSHSNTQAYSRNVANTSASTNWGGGGGVRPKFATTLIPKLETTISFSACTPITFAYRRNFEGTRTLNLAAAKKLVVRR